MKAKITHSFIIACALATVSYAQNKNVQQQAEVAVPMERISTQRPSADRTQTSEWYNYGQAIYDIGGNVSYFRNYLFPDSTVLFETSTGMAVVWKNSYGQVLDPISSLFINNTPLLATEDYTLDSVRFWYRYFRFQTGAPDTLIIQIYKHNHIILGTTSSSTPFARVDYNATTHIGANADFQYTVLLTDADTAMDAQRALELPVNLYVAPDEMVAATITYRPGNPFNAGDTIDVFMATPPGNQINAFIIYDFRDNDKTPDPFPGIYNNGLIATKEVRYNVSTNGWNGKYIPGVAFNAGYYHLDMDFKVTSNPVSVPELVPGAESVILFPNPSVSELRIKNSELKIESIEIFDVIGEKVFSELVTRNPEPVTVDISTFDSGIYFVKLKTEKGIIAKKIIKH